MKKSVYNDLSNPKVFDLEEDDAEYQEYLKLLETFSDPSKDDERIGQNIQKLVEYDLIDDSGDNQVLGHHAKRFVRLYNGYFRDLFYSIKKKYPNHNYATYLNDEDVAKYGLYPQNISVLLKQINARGSREFLKDEKQVYNEMIVSRILNFFDCKTVYNEVLIEDDDEYVLSVDFVKPYEHYYSLDKFDCGTPFDAFGDIKDTLFSIERSAKMFSAWTQTEFGKRANFNIEKIKRDFLYTFLVRGLFLADFDFCARNIGFVYNEKTNTFEFGPTLDFEYCFISQKGYGIESALKFAHRKYPDVYQKFIEHVEKFNRRNIFTLKRTYVEFIERYISDKNMQEEYISYIRENTRVVLEMSKLLQSRQKH